MNFLFEFKTAAQREKESAEYLKRSFPYEDQQYFKIIDLLDILIQKEKKELKVYNYLICRQELSDNNYSEPVNISDKKIIDSYTKLYSHFDKDGKRDIFKYLALAVVDLKIDEKLNYPSVEEIINLASSFEQLIK